PTSSRKYFGALGFIVLVAVIVASAIFLVHGLARLPGTVSANGAVGANGVPTVTIHESIFPFAPCTDPAFVKTHPQYAQCPAGDNTAWVTYSEPSLSVPAHTKVTMIITNYVHPNVLHNNFFLQPQGVIGNVVYVNGHAEKQVDSTLISHTFTIHAIVSTSQDWLLVSAPIAANPFSSHDAAGMALQPAVTSFSFMTNGPGEYIWQCIAPCGTGTLGTSGPMSTKGFMSGDVFVR
ncbi:MAG: hypothetical protein ABI068_06550, partial [Ktedonobacterales bacterium]